ncbi:hypothetical protein GCM10023150_07410 [Kangiella taiwanensis]|uniref:Uncharacterized protein n=1 Tax=Kangiella taiwanensis TaxID=1079179 RepID=A0ABP8HWK7_9GAMM
MAESVVDDVSADTDAFALTSALALASAERAVWLESASAKNKAEYLKFFIIISSKLSKFNKVTDEEMVLFKNK